MIRGGLATARGGVVTAKSDAARAGIDLLAAGGNAADATVAATAVLAAVDPANCGIGGYGGFAVVDRGDGGAVLQVDFNTGVPAGFRPDWRTGKRAPGVLVTPPAVVAGLCAIQRESGRAEPEEVWAPAIRLARQGVAVSEDLAHALSWAAKRHRGLNDARVSVHLDGAPEAEKSLVLKNMPLWQIRSEEYFGPAGCHCIYAGRCNGRD